MHGVSFGAQSEDGGDVIIYIHPHVICTHSSINIAPLVSSNYSNIAVEKQYPYHHPT
jgi:hypothetical protein